MELAALPRLIEGAARFFAAYFCVPDFRSLWLRPHFEAEPFRTHADEETTAMGEQLNWYVAGNAPSALWSSRALLGCEATVHVRSIYTYAFRAQPTQQTI